MPDSADPYNLQRFLDAQRPVYTHVLSELRTGRKQTHWIWFIFPQFAGLGYSATSRHYAIQSLEEAKAYLQHPILGQRLRECTQLVNQWRDRSIDEILGSIDALKFRSCVTLFRFAAEEDSIFLESLQTFFANQPDPLTLRQLDLAGS